MSKGHAPAMFTSAYICLARTRSFDCPWLQCDLEPGQPCACLKHKTFVDLEGKETVVEEQPAVSGAPASSRSSRQEAYCGYMFSAFTVGYTELGLPLRPCLTLGASGSILA